MLREVFGHAHFRPGQREAVEGVLAGKDAVVLLPTGGGKSLCYQVPAVVLARKGMGCTVVVSPLLALMHDQVRALRERGIAAAALNSTLSPAEAHEVADQFVAGELELLYVSPERAAQARFRKQLQNTAVALIAIDEAHCVSQWGHDFRPEYMRLHELRRRADCPLIALTATATRRVLDELGDKLQLEDPVRVRGGFTRENLSFEVHALPTDAARLAQLDAELKRALAEGGRAIVYCSTRKKTQSVAAGLKKLGYKAGWYHAGRTQLARERAEAAFASGRTPILVATNAFGMGIDFSDVRVLVHFQTPGSVEAYYQEAGRAGRDGAPARCVLFFGKSDMVTQRRLSLPRGCSRAVRERGEAALAGMLEYVGTAVCRQQSMSAYFGVPELPPACGRCDNCRGESAEIEVELRATTSPGTPTAPAVEVPEGLPAQILAGLQDLPKPVGRADLARALRGSKAKSVTRVGLQRLEAYGEFADHPEPVVLAALDALLAQGWLERRGRKYPKLWVAGRALGGKGGRGKGKSKGRTRSEVVRQLENYRARTARRLKWKPYMVFHRKVIQAIDKHEPRTLDELLRIPGLGEAKVERFGEEILDLLRRVREG